MIKWLGESADAIILVKRVFNRLKNEFITINSRFLASIGLNNSTKSFIL